MRSVGDFYTVAITLRRVRKLKCGAKKIHINAKIVPGIDKLIYSAR